MRKINFEAISPGFDAVIVGAGPAGVFAAKHMPHNFHVLLIDSSPVPRNKPCAGLLVEASKQAITQLNPPLEIFEHPQHLDLTYVDWNTGREREAKKQLWNVSRRKFDYWLAMLLPERVLVSERTRLVDFYPTRDKRFMVLTLDSGGMKRIITTKYLVGCDGAVSTVRQKLQAKPPYYVACQETLPKSRLVKPSFIFDDEITDFYSWVIPKSNRLLVGSALRGHEAKEKFELFKRKLSAKYGLSGEGERSVALISRPTSPKDICLGKGIIFLAGEAAGLVSPSSGEGISFAIRSGRFAGQALGQKASPLNHYRRLCKPLISEIERKAEKSKFLVNSRKRLALFEK